VEHREREREREVSGIIVAFGGGRDFCRSRLCVINKGDRKY